MTNPFWRQYVASIFLAPMTPTEAAEYLGLDIKTINRCARQGGIPAYALGDGKRKYWRFLQFELDAWLPEGLTEGRMEERDARSE